MIRGCFTTKSFHIFDGADEIIFWSDELLVALRWPAIKGVRTSYVLGSDSESVIAIDELLDFFFPVRIDVLTLNFRWPREFLNIERPFHTGMPETSKDVSTLRGNQRDAVVCFAISRRLIDQENGGLPASMSSDLSVVIGRCQVSILFCETSQILLSFQAKGGSSRLVLSQVSRLMIDSFLLQSALSPIHAIPPCDAYLRELVTRMTAL